MKKKLMLILLTLALCVAPLTACGSGDSNGGDQQKPPPENNFVVETEFITYTYKTANNGWSVKGTESGKSTATELVIPDQYDGFDVVFIEDYAFTRWDKITSLSIGSKVASIGTSAFYGCTSLLTVTIPDAVKTLKTSTFENCTSLQSAILPSEMRVLNNRIFADCSSLQSVTLPSGIRNIPSYAFSGCDLRSVVIPETVTQIKAYAFTGNKNLASVTLPSALTNIDTNAFYGAYALTEILFPSAQDLNIGDYAFARCGLKKVYLPSNVYLGTYVFEKLCWDDVEEKSSCEGIYYQSPEGDRGVNAFGYTWDNPQSGFRIYVPTGSMAYYKTANPGDESWERCVVNVSTPVLEEYDIATTFPNGFPCIK